MNIYSKNSSPPFTSRAFFVVLELQEATIELSQDSIWIEGTGRGESRLSMRVINESPLTFFAGAEPKIRLVNAGLLSWEAEIVIRVAALVMGRLPESDNRPEELAAQIRKVCLPYRATVNGLADSEFPSTPCSLSIKLTGCNPMHLLDRLI